MDRHLHFIHAISDDVEAVSLPELHQILQDYINRDEEEIVELEAERKERSWRKQEGKTKRELELEQQKIEELGEYRSGFGEFLPFLPSAQARQARELGADYRPVAFE